MVWRGALSFSFKWNLTSPRPATPLGADVRQVAVWVMLEVMYRECPRPTSGENIDLLTPQGPGRKTLFGTAMLVADKCGLGWINPLGK